MEVARIHPETAPAAAAILELDEAAAIRWELDMAEKARRDAADREEGARAEGEARGVARGRAEGAKENALKTARSFLEMGLDPVSVSKGAGLPLEEVEAIARDLQDRRP